MSFVAVLLNFRIKKFCLAVFVFTWKDWARLGWALKFPAEGSLPVIFSSMAFTPKNTRLCKKSPLNITSRLMIAEYETQCNIVHF